MLFNLFYWGSQRIKKEKKNQKITKNKKIIHNFKVEMSFNDEMKGAGHLRK